jgi:hypothetical protein
MESTFNDDGHSIGGEAAAREANPADAVRKLHQVGGQPEVNNLMADVQDL